MKRTGKSIFSEERVSKKTMGWLLLLCSLLIALFFVNRLHAFGSIAFWNDNQLESYPLRVLISTSIQNHIFPLWDHWTHGGYPLQSVLFMGSFSPIILFLSLFGIYTTYTYTIEILIVTIMGFIGMYLWLRRYSSGLFALTLAACFSMSGPQLLQTPLNFEFAASTAMLPWLAWGISSALEGRRYGIGVISFAVWIAQTEGYLGLNLIAWQFIILYCLLEWVTGNIKNHKNIITLRGIMFVLFGFMLGFFICNYAFIETFVTYGFTVEKIREGFNAFTASANLFSAFTLFFPNNVDLHSLDSYFARTAIMYFGSLQILFIIYAIATRKSRRNIWLLLVFSAVSFCAMLSTKYVPERFNSWIPFLQNVRWHAMYMTITIFFLATIASIGFQSFAEERNIRKKWLAVILFISIASFVAVKQSGVLYVSPLTYVLYPQTYILLMFLGLLVVSKTIPGVLYMSIVLSILEIVIVSIYIPSYGSLGEVKERESQKYLYQGTRNFPAVANRRDESVVQNQQYFSKQPALFGYGAIFHPNVRSFYDKPEYPIVMKQLFYVVDSKSLPIEDPFSIDITTFSPNRIEASIKIENADHEVVWSSPYSKNWELFINGKKSPTRQTIYGLTAFDLPSGQQSISLRYNPPYLVLSFIASIFAVFISIWAFIKAKSKNSKSRV